ncbi:dynein axonemal intermediate chain 7 [Antennarius striatus]|uniref:dynein axonemal intermediate chain 7 n=1 Tax=Antennarius striatus TaxID=241820 RepID=UPI0035B232F6
MAANKKGKLSKAQKAKEEEERRLREEEEARLQAEKEEQERLQREKKERELEQLKIKAREHRRGELNHLQCLLENNHAAVTEWKTKAAETEKWERYMRCDGTPDPEVQREINTFLTLWRDDSEVDSTHVLEQCNIALQLIEELEVLLRAATDPEEGQRYQEAILHLQELIRSKHDLTTEDILKGASENIDSDTGNMQAVISTDNITIYLWANINKNPRFKGYVFEEMGLGFELSRQLAVRDIALRIVHTRYDHPSLLVRMNELGTHAPIQSSPEGCEEAPEQKEVNEDETEQIMKEEVQSIQESDTKKSANSIQTEGASAQPAEGASAQPAEEANAQAAEGQQSEVQTQMEALGAELDSTSSVAQMHTSNVGVQVVDLNEYTPLGGIFFCDLFFLPPQGCQVQGWEIRQLLDGGLQTFTCPLETPVMDDSEGVTTLPVGVSMTLPDSVVFLKTPKPARWDATEKQWRMDWITDISYEETDAKFSLKMDAFQTFALMQETYANLPFQSWELRPLGQNSALFTVNGSLITVTIKIQENQCMLLWEEEEGLPHLSGKWMSGPALQKAILNTGINIFVNEHTDKYVSPINKDPLLENSAYEQMALFASACAFSWSKWNSKCDAQNLIVQACEYQDPDPVPEESWSLYLLEAQRSKKLEITDRSEVLSLEHYPGTEFHSTFIHTLQDNMSAGGIARTRESHYLFVDTVQSLLCATRPLIYSNGE